VKQRRELKRMTLLLIAELLRMEGVITSRTVADAAQMDRPDVSQIFRRLSGWGWLAQDVRPDRKNRRGAKLRYRLTAKGRIEGNEVLRRQASVSGGKWRIDDRGTQCRNAAEAPNMRTPPRVPAPSLHRDQRA